MNPLAPGVSGADSSSTGTLCLEGGITTLSLPDTWGLPHHHRPPARCPGAHQWEGDTGEPSASSP